MTTNDSRASYSRDMMDLANEYYKTRKMVKHPYVAPEEFPDIVSDQVKAIFDVLISEIWTLQQQIKKLKSETQPYTRKFGGCSI